MIKSGHYLWARHPGVRAGRELTAGERAADRLKRGFGTWTALFGVGATIAVWMLAQATPLRWDPRPYILLNLVLSCIAAVQGIVLQISANRGDRISAEVAMHTAATADELLTLQRQQCQTLTVLGELGEQQAEQQEILEAVLHKVDPGALIGIWKARPPVTQTPPAAADTPGDGR